MEVRSLSEPSSDRQGVRRPPFRWPLFDSGTSVASNHKLASYEQSKAVGRGSTSTGWSWGAGFFDFDNDGDDDLYVTNGLHEYFIYSSQFKVKTPEGEKEMQFAVHEKEPNVFYVNENGRLQNRSAQSGVCAECLSSTTLPARIAGTTLLTAMRYW